MLDTTWGQTQEEGNRRAVVSIPVLIVFGVCGLVIRDCDGYSQVQIPRGIDRQGIVDAIQVCSEGQGQRTMAGAVLHRKKP